MFSTKVYLLEQEINVDNYLEKIQDYKARSAWSLYGRFLDKELPCIESSKNPLTNQLSKQLKETKATLNYLRNRGLNNNTLVSDLNQIIYVEHKFILFTKEHFGTASIPVSIARPVFEYKCIKLQLRLEADLRNLQSYNVIIPNTERMLNMFTDDDLNDKARVSLFNLFDRLNGNMKVSCILWISNLIEKTDLIRVINLNKTMKEFIKSESFKKFRNKFV